MEESSHPSHEPLTNGKNENYDGILNGHHHEGPPSSEEDGDTEEDERSSLMYKSQDHFGEKPSSNQTYHQHDGAGHQQAVYLTEHDEFD